MFQSDALKDHLQTSYTIENKSLVFAEWNLNQPENIARIGNYRYRPSGGIVDAQFATVPLTYDINDAGGYYTGATDADIVIDGGYDDNGDPVSFTTAKNKMKMLYSLEDCFNPFRPRSGINKMVYLGLSGAGHTDSQYIANFGSDSATRPRYYLSSKYDQFKYWTSYRTQDGVEYGVSKTMINGRSYIDDAVPFVVYNENLTANRIVIKMQTNVGETDLGDIRVGETTIPDPLYGVANQTTPVRWRVEVLKGTSWVSVATFDENSLRPDGTAIIQSDGYVELAYGLQLPNEYKDTFVYAGEISSLDSLPTSAPNGYAYLLKDNSDDKGIFYIYNGTDSEWVGIDPQYTWDIADSFVSKNSKFVTDLTNPDYFWDQGKKVYREIEIFKGIRVVVSTMNKTNCTFDLIEMSPRLSVDFTDRVQDFSITRTLSDLGNGKIPVGSLLAGTGQININDNDFAFVQNNSFNETTSQGSIVSKYLLTHVKFMFYDVIRNVDSYDYYVPIKTMYSEGLPQSQGNFDQISVNLRDAYLILESSPAPSLMLTDISLSASIMILLDYIGFSNYVFKRIDGVPDPVIPYFFVAPNQNVAEVLTQLAVATQSAMFFDEYNNFVLMTKEYLLPDAGGRDLDITLFGNKVDSMLPNIIQISSSNKTVNNNGQINYTQRYIQRTYGSTRQSMYSDEFKTWVYTPTLMWEVTGDQTTKAINETATEQSSYSLSAMPLNSSLTIDVPTVINNTMTNNVLDVGESIYYIARYNGFFYANGEIIKYDAVEYSITGQATPVWINNVQEYQNYFLNIPFNGKMYPTGKIRIYSEPEYIIVDGVTVMSPGPAKIHGRGQFGTTITNHEAGISTYWTDLNNVYGCQQQGNYIYSADQVVNYPLGLEKNTAAGISNAKARESSRNGIIKNTTSQVYWTERQINEFTTAQSGTVQSSALVFTGPNFDTGVSPRDYVSYIHKPLDNAYKHFGTRMRIIGKIEAGANRVQTPIGSAEYISISPTDSSQQMSISGGSGGIGVMVNNTTNNGYYFEIAALTNNNISNYYDSNRKQIVSYPVAVGGIALSGSGNRIVTVTTSVNHQFKVGEKVVMAGFVRSPVSSEVNGEFTITAVTARTFTYDSGVSIPAVPTSGGQAEIYIDSGVNINNLIFYKVVEGPDPVTGLRGAAYPVKLWSGLGNILVDSGRFTGQYRTVGENAPTVYDLAVEYKDSGTIRTFYLYVNDKQVATVVDSDPLIKNNNMCVFVRGSTKCMFENVYALSENYAQNTIATAVDNISQVFGDTEINSSEALRKYAVNGFVQASYLSGISSYQPPDFNMYFEEFGTILREAAHFNIEYDRAYPALYAKLAPTMNRIKTYSSSGFYAGAYAADFLVFNCLDKNINLDPTSGNFLRVQGITFTQNTTKTLTVDDYFNKVSNLADPQFDSGNLVYSPLHKKELYNKIKISRTRHGNQEFSIDSMYIQTDAAANDTLGWIINRTMEPKKNIGMTTFGTQMIQLGDLVNISYTNFEGISVIADVDTKFVVYNIEYGRTSMGTNMTLYLAEV
jgi:hypothetical protein